MDKKRLVILSFFAFLLFLVFIIPSANAILWEGNTPGYYYQYHYFNGTIVDKDIYPAYQPGSFYYNYLINVDGTTFFLHGWYYGHRNYVGNFNVGDKVTIYGNTIKEEKNMHEMSFGDFNGKYYKTFEGGKKFPEIWLGGKKLRLADGFVRVGSTYSTSSSSLSSNKGISFSDSKQYFTEASDTVRKHVFDESDRNGDGYLSKSEYKIFKDVKRFTKDYANVKNNEYVETPDLWNGDGTTRTRYCADHGRVAVVGDDKCPWCKKYRRDPRTRVDSTRYV